MSKRWSKLQRDFYRLRADGLDLQLQCRVYRMDSQRGSSDIPRYWITLEQETIWDYPKDFIHKSQPNREEIKLYPYGTDIPDISSLIREYIDTVKTELMSKKFEKDYWGLINIFRAADRRIGARRFEELKRKTNNRAALKVLNKRLEELSKND